jgi:hypothetical protein
MRRILLVEPGYKNKYPPLGLMKISTYHKLKGDFVQFAKGCIKELQEEKWDRIYISTLFTFYWAVTIKTIEYYSDSIVPNGKVIAGGVMATLLRKDLEKETGVTVIPGLIDHPGILDVGDRMIVDSLTPDYNLLEMTDYKYGLNDSYIGYATRGCPNKCDFCAVRRIEPLFKNYLPLKKQIQSIEMVYGPKQHLVLMDNNVLASDYFERIIEDICDLGFSKGARFRNKNRFVDFNQGIDLRLLKEDKMRLLSRIAIKPLRLAFDHIELKDEYIDRVHMAVRHGVKNLSNYVLYNYKDTPKDFYERLRINVELNEKLGTQIYSFPMKYIPLDAKDRTYIGNHWSKRLIRGVQCILLATKGSVGTHMDFFEAAFGRTSEEFIEIAMMPEEYIIFRNRHIENGDSDKWKRKFRAMDEQQRGEFIRNASKCSFKNKETIDKELLEYLS